MRIFLILLLVFTFAGFESVYTQETGEVENNTKKEPFRASFPWGWNRPYKNIDNFENSSLGKKRSSVTKGSRNANKSAVNNIEINKQIDADIQKSREKQQEFEIGYSSSIGLSVDPDSSVVETTAIEQTETVKGTLTNNKIIRWVDKDGVVHVTNDPTEVYKRSKE